MLPAGCIRKNTALLHDGCNAMVSECFGEGPAVCHETLRGVAAVMDRRDECPDATRMKCAAVDQVTTRYLQYNALGDDYGLFAANRERWLMQMAPDADGRQQTGDMTKLDSVFELERQFAQRKADLYTSDLGVSAKSDFNRQEELNAQPHLGQDLAGLLTLTLGGNFVVKHYTLFEPFSYTLILVLGTLFEEFFLCKPVTSRPTNSECYLVGRGFLGLPPRIRDALQNRMQDFSMRPLLSLAIVQEMEQPPNPRRPGSHGPSGLLAAVKLLWTHQAEYLEETISLFHTAGHGTLKNLGTCASLEKLKQQREEDFISTNRLTTKVAMKCSTPLHKFAQAPRQAPPHGDPHLLTLAQRHRLRTFPRHQVALGGPPQLGGKHEMCLLPVIVGEGFPKMVARYLHRKRVGGRPHRKI
ncbi:hypothetical protein CYMTET_8399 [Cymbomonas tetramitiformis]|uniref:Ribosomal RNA methyltransferase FtsJ domain-containing protein n=1 Tax=Cymbomonas tetramitiformis TaxID=36881 RepID=A0AAE0GV01_9CHLO|nr:hypothetical protein CYMTET_8399 [Cymbomonas tetramitiformis]